ncbi:MULTISPECIES: glycosyltransferase family 1 protein [unclassified Arcicella]|uniref:glycosyltransferase family 4 protein n=1 Tax=unclassified Arcicella TaxID=2644986 RepID=UPI00285F4FAE|nr:MULTISPECIES: glycosyltransferase family 1 protein [unclassified Arcicella]MDR6562500.1 glycosyltransferase involved in cell wall biosynthesis [Arcicella sp. BE51]MDR6812587.1 glycosyltransferase involved in cell wall biosynthesis [Arcicella sp. BE140]MDR6823899.1 glycosyltransferase involved in cell wall biosynthesis [Arcicella sp. BE139]
MKILYDHQAFTGQRYGGVARYFHDLMESLVDMGVGVKLSLPFSNNEYLKNSSVRRPNEFRHIFGFMPTNMLVSRTNRLNSIVQLQKGQFDVFHPTFFHNYYLNHLKKKPFVLTYHDCIKERFNLNHIDNASHAQKQELLNKAAKIIAISENTKADLLEFYQIKPEKIEVIYHSSSFRNHQLPVGFQVKTPEKYLLYVGARNDYKNFTGFVTSIASVLHQYPDIQLLCAGGGDFNKTEHELIDSLNLQTQVKHFHFQSDDTLFYLYQNAIAFVYPSLYEGFGIPILEAFACGCPVVLSNTSCFPEVAQDAALYFNPNDKEDIADKITQIIEDKFLRKSLIEKGFNRQQNFSAEKTATQTLNVYKSIL